MKKYDTYKDSGIQWIGEVPEHWGVVPIKYITNIYTGNSISDKDKENYADSSDAYPYIATKDIDAQTLLADYENGMYTQKSDLLFKIAPKGSTLLCIEGGSAGRKKTYLTEDVSFVNKLCCITANDRLDSKLLYYYINSNEFVNMFNHHITGLIGGVSTSLLKTFPIPLPPLSEQQAIAAYLDKKTAEIGQAISLYEEQKRDLQAYRNRLIDETIWHEQDKKNNIKYLVELITVKSNSTPKVALENIEGATGNFITTNSKFEGNGVAFIKDDVLYGKLRPYLRKVWRAEFEGAAVGDFYVYRVKNNVLLSKHLQYLLLSDTFTNLANGSTYGAKMPRVSSDFIGNILIPLPSLSEQQAIVAYLDKKTSEIDAAIQKIDTQIAELQAYRTALISEAVTGKIDVR